MTADIGYLRIYMTDMAEFWQTI